MEINMVEFDQLMPLIRLIMIFHHGGIQQEKDSTFPRHGTMDLEVLMYTTPSSLQNGRNL